MRIWVALAVVLASIGHIIEVCTFALGRHLVIHAGSVTLTLASPTVSDIFYSWGSICTLATRRSKLLP